MSGFLKSSIGRKIAMALSAFFLMFFILQHFAINILSVFNPDAFNEVSHFMGTNPLVQFVLQPILIFGVVFHFVMGFVLEFKNRASRSVSYAVNNGNANSTWMSRNMIYSGGFILIFLVIHFIDFWIPELNVKYLVGDTSGLLADGSDYRYFEELQHKFVPLLINSQLHAWINIFSFLYWRMSTLMFLKTALESNRSKSQTSTTSDCSF